MRHICNIGWALVLACACRESEPISQTVVWLDAEPSARTTLARVTVQSSGPTGSLPEVTTEHPEWPIKLVFSPKYEDPRRTFVLQVEARDEHDVRLVSLRLQTGFVREQTRYARLMIPDACAVRRSDGCGVDQACNVWMRDVDAAELGTSASKPRRVDVQCGEAPVKPGEDVPEQPSGTAGSEAPVAAGAAGGGAGSAAGSGAGSGAAGKPVGPSDTSAVSCNAGYVPITGGGCREVDECADENPCGEHGHCENTPGSYQCSCDAGYQSLDRSCVDIDECKTDNGGCEVLCNNSSGSVACACEGDASWLKSDRKACGSFGAPKKLSLTSSGEPAQPRFAFDAAGNGLAAWTQSDGTRSYVWTRRYRAAEGWAAYPARLQLPEAGDASTARVALDASGRGAVIWVQTNESLGDLWAARYTGQAFEPAEKIETEDAASALDPSLAIGESGDGFAVWTQSDGSKARIWVNRLRAESGWQGAQAIQNSTADAFGARIALDAAGNASVAWTQAVINESEGARIAPWSARYDAALARWVAPVVLDLSGTAGVPDVALFEPGYRGLTVWTRASAGRAAVWARSHTLQASVREPTKIVRGDSELLTIIPRVVLSPSGQGAAVWAQGKSSAYEVWANRYDGSADSWVEAVQLSTKSSTSVPFPQLAVGANGDGFAVWSEITGTARSVRAQRLQADGGFVGGLALTSDTTADPPQNSPPQIAIDAQGGAMAIWDVHDGGQYSVWAAKFE